jgi:hypothetical protein
MPRKSRRLTGFKRSATISAVAGLPSPHRAYLEKRLRRSTPRWPKGSSCGAWPPAGSISPTAWLPMSVSPDPERMRWHGVPGAPAPVAGAPCTGRPRRALGLGSRRWRRLRAVLHRPATATTDAGVPLARGTDDLHRSHRGQPWTAMDLRGRKHLSPASRGLPALLGRG